MKMSWDEAEALHPTWSDLEGKRWLTLEELAGGYSNAAALLRIAIEDLKEEIKAADNVHRIFLEDKLKAYRTALREVRAIRKICLTYYQELPSTDYSVRGMKAGRVRSV